MVEKIRFPEKIVFLHFFILISPNPLPKPSDGPKNHPQTINIFFCGVIFFKKIDILIKSSINLHLDLLGPGFDRLDR